MQIKVPAALVTVKGDVVTINNASVVAYDGENFTLEVTPGASTAQTAKASAKAEPKKSNLSEEFLKARAAKAAETKRVKALCEQNGIEYKKGMSEADVKAILAMGEKTPTPAAAKDAGEPAEAKKPAKKGGSKKGSAKQAESTDVEDLDVEIL